MIAEIFNSKKTMNIVLLITTLLLVGFLIFYSYGRKDFYFTAFHPVNILWYASLILKLRADRVNRKKYNQ